MALPRRVLVAAAISVLLFVSFAALRLQLIPSWNRDSLEQPLIRHDEGHLILPPEYKQLPEESVFCAERYGLLYLETLGQSAINHCTTDSASSLTCFHSRTDPHVDRADPFCIAGPASFDDRDKKFSLGCRMREW